MALSGLLKDLATGAVPHGFRSSFRDWTAEETNHPREVVEAALAHVVQNKVEAAYARSDLFERRRLEGRELAPAAQESRVQPRRPRQVDCEHHSPAYRCRSVTLVGAGG